MAAGRRRGQRGHGGRPHHARRPEARRRLHPRRHRLGVLVHGGGVVPPAHHRPPEGLRRRHVRRHHLQAGEGRRAGARPGAEGEGADLPVAHRPDAADVRPLHLPQALQGLPGQPPQLQGGDRPRHLPREHRGPLRRGRVLARPRRARHDAQRPQQAVRALRRAAGGPVRRLVQDQHEEGLRADRPRRLRVRPEVRPEEGDDRPQGERRPRDRRPLLRGSEEGRGRVSRRSPSTTRTSTRSACGS